LRPELERFLDDGLPPVVFTIGGTAAMGGRVGRSTVAVRASG
jgi:hypothetical protein